MWHEIKNKEAGILKDTAHCWTENSHLCMKIFFLGCSEDFGRQFKNCIWKLIYITKKDRRFISCGVFPISAFICKPWWWLVGQDEQDTCALHQSPVGCCLPCPSCQRCLMFQDIFRVSVFPCLSMSS